jgi:hypothetical protein
VRGLDPENAAGFIYLIVEKSTGRKYVGKKNFRGRGRLNKGQPSNWKRYTSSSKFLNQQIREQGKQAFEFIIIEQYYTQGGLSFAEVWTQVYLETPSNNEEFINRFIDRVTWKVTEPVTDQHKRRIDHYVKSRIFTPTV